MGKQLVGFIFAFFFLALLMPTLNCKAYDYSETYFAESNLSECSNDMMKDVICKSQRETNNALILNFDVSQSGKVLICFDNNTINVYDNNGNFDFSIIYNTLYGRSVALWYRENIVLYVFRSNYCIFFDENGTIQKNYEYIGNSSDIRNIPSKTTEINYKNITYTLTRGNFIEKLFDLECHKLMCTNNDAGKTKTIYIYYEKTTEAMKTLAIKTIIGIGIILLCVIVIYRNKIKDFIQHFKV